MTSIVVNRPIEDIVVPPYQVQRVATGLDSPLFATSPPGDSEHLFIVERTGQIRILERDTGELLATPFLDLPEDALRTVGEAGLLGLAFHPDYHNNGEFFVNYTNLEGANVIARYTVSADDYHLADPHSATTILTLEQFGPAYNVGWIGFGPDGYLYIGSGAGDTAFNPHFLAQDINDLHGKILRINIDGDDFPDDDSRNYAIPEDNPFVGTDGADEIWVYGLRQPFRPSFDSATGDFYIPDVGQNSREEINFQHDSSTGGENYGWRAREGRIPTPEFPNDPTPPNAVDPIYDYPHGTGPFQGNSVTGGYVYRGPIEDLQGQYIFGDFINGKIWSIDVDRDTGTVRSGSLTDLTSRFRPDAGSIDLISSFGTDGSNNLYIIDYLGEVFQVVPRLSNTYVIDLSDVFTGGEDHLHFWVGDNDNPDVVSTELDGAILRVTLLRATSEPVDITVGAFDIAGNEVTDTFRIESDLPPTVVVGTNRGGSVTSSVVNRGQVEQQLNLAPYTDLFLGGVRVATGDVTGDGFADIVTAAGTGGAPHVRVFDGVTGAQVAGPIGSFFAFDPGFTGGLYVAVADFDRDGKADIVTAAGEGGGPHVRVFSGADGSVLSDFFAYDTRFIGGVRVAAGDITGDGIPDIITGAGFGGAPHVRVFDSLTGAQFADPIGSFLAYDLPFVGGIYVAAGDVNGDGYTDIITGAGEGGAPHVRVFDGTTRSSTVRWLPKDIGDFFAYDTQFRGGVRVAATDLNGDGLADILTSAGPGAGPHVRGFSGTRDDDPDRNLKELVSFFAADPSFTGGLFVAGNVDHPSHPDSHELRLAEGSAPQGEAASLSLPEAEPIFAAALNRLQAAGVPAERIESLRALEIQIADLAGNVLAEARPGSIVLDINAAGFGWYLDATPATDEEFASGSLLAINPESQGRIDLLTVILHELGHHLGGDDLDSETHPGHFLAETLAPGERRLARSEDLDSLFSQADLLDALLEPGI